MSTGFFAEFTPSLLSGQALSGNEGFTLKGSE